MATWILSPSRPDSNKITTDLRASPPRLLIGTGNAHKLEEIARILADVAVEVVGTRVLGSTPEIDENGATFAANAAIKARAFARASLELPTSQRPRWVLADDSGLCVDALDGRPGVHSCRYANDRIDSPTDADNIHKLLKELDRVDDQERQAHFACQIVVVALPESDHGEPPVVFTGAGECHGRITRGARGEGGFGYDPIFEIPDLGKCFAELSADEKNARSHRGRALALVSEFLQIELGEQVGR